MSRLQLAALTVLVALTTFCAVAFPDTASDDDDFMAIWVDHQHLHTWEWMAQYYTESRNEFPKSLRALAETGLVYVKSDFEWVTDNQLAQKDGWFLFEYDPDNATIVNKPGKQMPEYYKRDWKGDTFVLNKNTAGLHIGLGFLRDEDITENMSQDYLDLLAISRTMLWNGAIDMCTGDWEKVGRPISIEGRVIAEESFATFEAYRWTSPLTGETLTLNFQPEKVQSGGLLVCGERYWYDDGSEHETLWLFAFNTDGKCMAWPDRELRDYEGIKNYCKEELGQELFLLPGED